MTDILMPKATAVWLVDNTSLTFEQIAEFCGLHPLEVKGIADGEVARDIRGADPIANGQLSREELDAAQADSKHHMRAQKSRHAELLKPLKKAPRYTPVSRRQDRPDAIAWFVRNHPEVTDAQISKILGTTKSTIESVRSRTHWTRPTSSLSIRSAWASSASWNWTRWSRRPPKRRPRTTPRRASSPKARPCVPPPKPERPRRRRGLDEELEGHDEI